MGVWRGVGAGAGAVPQRQEDRKALAAEGAVSWPQASFPLQDPAAGCPGCCWLPCLRPQGILWPQAPAAESTHRSRWKEQGLNCRRKSLSQRGLGAGEQQLRVPQALVRISGV